MHFNYEIEQIRDGQVIDRWTEKNLIPQQGLDHMLDVTCKGGSQVGTWYVLIYEGNYTPVSTDTAATFPGLATECTAYAEATRPTWNEGAISTGSVSNTLNKAEFTINASKTIYGCALVSVATKGSTSGILLSAVKFGTSKAYTSGDVLRVTAPVSLTAS